MMNMIKRKIARASSNRVVKATKIVRLIAAPVLPGALAAYAPSMPMPKLRRKIVDARVTCPRRMSMKAMSSTRINENERINRGNLLTGSVNTINNGNAKDVALMMNSRMKLSRLAMRVFSSLSSKIGAERNFRIEFNI